MFGRTDGQLFPPMVPPEPGPGGPAADRVADRAVADRAVAGRRVADRAVRRGTAVRLVCATAALSALALGCGGQAAAAVPGAALSSARAPLADVRPQTDGPPDVPPPVARHRRHLPRPAVRPQTVPPQAARQQAVRQQAVQQQAETTTLVTAGVSNGPEQPTAVPVVDVITAAPGVTHPGGSVDLRTFADCVTGSIVTSPAFGKGAALGPAADGGLFAQATVAQGTAPGTYTLTESCRGRTVASGSLTVVRRGPLAAGGGWGATRDVVADLGGVRTLVPARSAAAEYASLALTGAAALAGLVLTVRRRRPARRG